MKSNWYSSSGNLKVNKTNHWQTSHTVELINKLASSFDMWVSHAANSTVDTNSEAFGIATIHCSFTEEQNIGMARNFRLKWSISIALVAAFHSTRANTSRAEPSTTITYGHVCPILIDGVLFNIYQPKELFCVVEYLCLCGLETRLLVWQSIDDGFSQCSQENLEHGWN